MKFLKRQLLGWDLLSEPIHSERRYHFIFGFHIKFVSLRYVSKVRLFHLFRLLTSNCNRNAEAR